MSQETLLRGFFSGLFAMIIAWQIFSGYDRDMGWDGDMGERARYLPYISGALLPIYLLTLMMVAAVFVGMAEMARMLLSLCFTIFLQISIYYLLLLPLLPVFRKYISARACAMLWMLPNYLYIFGYGSFERPSPRFVIPVSGETAWTVFAIWLAGFFVVLGWKTTEHLLFRRRVLSEAVPVTDREVLVLWEETVSDMGIKKAKFSLVISPHVDTPLTVGLLRRKTVVLLPRRPYTAEELELIFRHELIHITREDAWAKYFLVFCTAMCWFNPLMWVAMRKSAEDLELGCDETVLLEADAERRKQYARLLLDTAGDQRGFTTCLSASAKAMRYRLRNITVPRRRGSGALAAGVIFFLLCMTSGHTALSYGAVSGREILYPSGDLENYMLRYISKKDDPYSKTYSAVDEAAFHAYLSGLTLTELTGDYSFSDSGTEFHYILDGPEESTVLALYDNAVKVTPLSRAREARRYYIPEGVDWEYLATVIEAAPAMNAHLTREGEAYGDDIHARLDQIFELRDGERLLTYQDESREGYDDVGIYGASPYHRVAFSFSEKAAAPCQVTVENWERTQHRTMTQQDLEEPFVIEIPYETAHYIVTAFFYDRNGVLCEARFCFDIGDLG